MSHTNIYSFSLIFEIASGISILKCMLKCLILKKSAYFCFLILTFGLLCSENDVFSANNSLELTDIILQHISLSFRPLFQSEYHNKWHLKF